MHLPCQVDLVATDPAPVFWSIPDVYDADINAERQWDFSAILLSGKLNVFDLACKWNLPSFARKESRNWLKYQRGLLMSSTWRCRN